MKTLHPLLYIGLIAFSACGKFNTTPEVSINFQDPSNVTETRFQVSWSINTTDYQSLTFILAADPNFEEVIRSQTFDDIGTNSIILEDLRGAATYYYRISLLRSPGNIFISNTVSIEMPFRTESISFDTPDMANLKGFIYYRGEMEGRRPAVLLMHEFGIFVNGWINSDMLKELVAEGYVCLIYSNRGHGNSSGLDDITDLLDNPELLINDLKGAISFMQENDRVMADSIGLMGASMGASMAVAGNGSEVVRSSVSLSPANLHIHSMHPGVPLKSVFYLVGDQDIVDSGDGVIDFPAEAASLFELTEDPKKLMVLKNNPAHGTELLEATGVKEAILDWFKKELPVLP
jgi:dienelactone hydrolase